MPYSHGSLGHLYLIAKFWWSLYQRYVNIDKCRSLLTACLFRVFMEQPGLHQKAAVVLAIPIAHRHQSSLLRILDTQLMAVVWMVVVALNMMRRLREQQIVSFLRVGFMKRWGRCVWTWWCGTRIRTALRSLAGTVVVCSSWLWRILSNLQYW